MTRQRRKSVLAKCVMAVFGLVEGTIFTPRARGSLLINLVFPDGSNSMSLTPDQVGQDFPILVYGTVTGVNPVTTTPGATTGNFDGIQFTYYDIASSTGPGEALPGGIDNGSKNPAYAPTLNRAFAAIGSEPGTVQDLNGDGIADLGGTSDLTDISKPRSAAAVWDDSYLAGYNPTGTPGIIVGGANNNSVSFLLETIYFQTGYGLTPGESTSFSPTAVPLGSYAAANYFTDVPSIAGLSVNQSIGAQYVHIDVSSGAPVQFNVVAVPEPATATAACLLAAGVLTRRRRRVPQELCGCREKGDCPTFIKF